MSIDADAILTAVRELLEGDIGEIRTVTAGRLNAMASEDRSTLAQALDTWKGARFAVDVAAVNDHRDTISENASHGLRRIAITITTWHRLNHYARKQSTRDLRIADAIEDGVTIREAMCFPGNLTRTSAAVGTGIIRGSVAHVSSTSPRLLGEQKVAETVHRFNAILLVPANTQWRAAQRTLTFGAWSDTAALGFTVTTFANLSVGVFVGAGNAVGVKQPIGTAATSVDGREGWYTTDVGMTSLIWLWTPGVNANSTGTATVTLVGETQ